jgi:hypothetical protein
MARFNSKKISIVGPDTVNLAGGQAFQESPELELVSLLLTSMVQDQFYRSAEDQILRLDILVDKLIGSGGAYFCAQACLYARREFGLRSITHLLAAQLARKARGLDWTKDFYNAIVYRPDDMLEIMALVLGGGKNVPNALKDGFARALGRLDAYSLGKYKGERRAVKMVDVINLTHPKSTEPIDRLIHGRLEAAQTWEAGLSDVGQRAKDDTEKQELKAALWADLIKKKKLGYLALLRNVRNIAEQVTDKEVMEIAVDALQNRAMIKKSLVFPFQIHTAYDAICGDNHGSYLYNGPVGNRKPIDPVVERAFMLALQNAAEIALDNVPKFSGDTLIAMDLSGSMISTAVGSSTTAKIGGLFAAILWKANPGADLMEFGSRAVFTTKKMVGDSLFSIVDYLSAACYGGTNFHEIFRVAKRWYDRVIIISDCQAWEEHTTPARDLAQYRARTGADPHIFSLDLCGMGTLQFPESKVYAMAGFSDKIFEVMKMLENDRMAMVNIIKNIDIHNEALMAGAKRGE